MGKFYRANEEFKNYLIETGLTFHNREEEHLSYLTDSKTGKQVKIDTKRNLVSLLDQNGNTVDYSSSFTDNQIVKFLEN